MTQELIFKSYDSAEKFAKSTGNHYESSFCTVGSGQVFCYRVIELLPDNSFRVTHKLIVDESLYEETEYAKRGE